MLLADYLRISDESVGEFAHALGVCEATLYRYLAGTTIPARRVMRDIVQLTRGWVTPNDFYGVGVMVDKMVSETNLAG